MRKRLSIVYMGTPEFAVPCLERLVQSGHDISLVVTQPDKPRGRGRKPDPTPVREAARKYGLTLIQPERIRSKAIIDRIAAVSPDLMVVVAYGAILPPSVLQLPRLGAVNIHPSLLPAYRGPAPIQWAVVNGEKETGVTSIFMDEGMDSGDIILTEKVAISPDETSGELHGRLAVTGAAVLGRTVELIESGTAEPVPQDHSRATYAPPLKKGDNRIDWHRPAPRLVDFIRGMAPRPGAYTFCDSKRYKIYQARTVNSEAEVPPGTVVKGFPGELRIQAKEGAVSVLTIQSASGKVLAVEDFLRGRAISENAVFS